MEAGSRENWRASVNGLDPDGRDLDRQAETVSAGSHAAEPAPPAQQGEAGVSREWLRQV